MKATAFKEMRASGKYFLRLAQEKNNEVLNLKARVVDLELAIGAVQREHAQAGRAIEACKICSPQDKSWPCVTRLHLDAVLPPAGQ